MLPLLPPSASSKLTALAQSSADAEALKISAMHTTQRLEANIEGYLQERSRLDERNPRHAALTREIDAIKAQITSVKEMRVRRQERSKSDAQTLAQCRAWLSALPAGVELEAVTVAAPKVTDLLAGIVAAREQIETLKQRMRQLKAAPLPVEDLKQKAVEYVEALAASARARVGGLKDGQFGVEFASDAARDHRMLQVAAWLHPEQLVRRLHEEIDKEAVDDGAVAEIDKKAGMAELETLLLAVERGEEALVEAALAKGMDAFRRPRANPAAILGVQIVKKVKAQAAA